MKKIVFFFVLTMFSALSVTAQTRYTSAVMTNIFVSHPDKTPFDTWKNDYFVAFGYTEDTALHPAFYLVDCSSYNNLVPAMPIATPAFAEYLVQVTLPPELFGFSVNDIYVADDYAFFCGQGLERTDTVDVAVVGYFHLSDFFTSNVQINYLILYNSTSYSDYPISLEQLVAYWSVSGYDVVAYGERKDGQNQVVEIKNVMSPTPSCDAADMPYSPFPYNPLFQDRLTIDDVLLTESNVVFTGHDHNMITLLANYPWYILGRKGDVVKDICPPYNNSYYLPVADESEGFVLGTALEGDLFAMAYVHLDNINRQRFIRLRVIDPVAVTNSYSQEFDIDKVEIVHKMIYLKGVGTVDLIVEEPEATRFFQLDPYATANYISKLFELDGAFRRIRAKDAEHFISSYGNQFYIDDRMANLPHSNPSCPINKDKVVQMMPNLQPVQAQPGTFSPHLNLIPAQTIDAVQTHVVKADCFSYE